MSIICSEVEESICNRAALTGASEFIDVSIDQATKYQLNLPAEYKYHSVFLPRKYQQWADRLLNFEVRESDIWIVGFPKTGTTWIHNIVWQLKNNFNFDARPKSAFDEFYEGSILFDETAVNENEKLLNLIDEWHNRFEQYEKLISPRIFKSHLPAFLLPKNIWTKKSKIIYIARNPFDVIVSRFHAQQKNIINYKGTIDDMCHLLINSELSYSPFFDHINSFWQLENLDHVLFLTYENCSADLFGAVKRINEFLGCSYSDEQLERLAEHVSFGEMRKKSPENLPDKEDGGTQDQDYK